MPRKFAILFGKQAPSRSTVFKWYGKFRAGRRSFDDDVRCGPSATAVTPANVIRARQLMKENPRVTYLELQHTLDISSGSVFIMLHEHLQYSSVSPDGYPVICLTSRKRQGWNGASTCCQSLLEVGEIGSRISSQVMKHGFTAMTSKPSNSRTHGSFPTKIPL